MPYYCTVPQCTSMAGKAKNVSFHQFPRDEELARVWNIILRRGKPYTKYSKVCSLHFRAEDYTITSVGKNKGQWRTLRKDAIPSRNLPTSTPPPTNHHHSGNRRNSGAWLPGASPAPATVDPRVSHLLGNSGAWLPGASPAPATVDPRLQHQMAQAIYMQTMLAMQARQSENGSPTGSEQQRITLADIEQLLQQRNIFPEVPLAETTSYKCNECSKCFKDPDVFVLHKRTHVSLDDGRTRNNDNDSNSDEISDENDENDIDRVQDDAQENDESNDDNHRNVVENGDNDNKPETLKANPILANLLRSGVDGINGNVLDVNNILSIENQIMTALAANMESYIKNLTHLLAEAKKEKEKDGQGTEDNEKCQSEQDNDNDTCQSDRQSDLDGMKSGDENCHISNDARQSDDDIGSNNKSKNKPKYKNVANKSKSIKKRGRKSRASKKNATKSKITKIKVEISGNDIEKHEDMDVDEQENDKQTNDDPDSSKNDNNPKLEANMYVKENDESEKCTLTYQNQYEKSLNDGQNAQLEFKRKDHSEKDVNSKLEINSEIDSKIEHNSISADKIALNKCENNSENCEKIVKSEEESLENNLIDSDSDNNVNTGNESPIYVNKCVQTDETCDDIEESLYPAYLCDSQDLNPSKDSYIGLENSL